MHPVRIGRIARTLRRRLGWRQVDVANRAGVSQQTVSRVERGRIGELSFRSLSRVLAELEAEVDLSVRWRGGELDRFIDEDHAQLVVAIIDRLERARWKAVPEVTYSINGDRGSIDVLGYQGAACALLVIEAKTDITTAEGTLRRHDEKVRHAQAIVEARFGWEVKIVARLLVLPDSSTSRRRVERHAALFDRTYPLRGTAVRAWLRKPMGAISGLVFLSPTQPKSDRRGLGSRRRVRTRGRPGGDGDPRSREVVPRVRFIDSTVDNSPTG